MLEAQQLGLKWESRIPPGTSVLPTSTIHFPVSMTKDVTLTNLMFCQ
jgi:hypothetical protein